MELFPLAARWVQRGTNAWATQVDLEAFAGRAVQIAAGDGEGKEKTTRDRNNSTVNILRFIVQMQIIIFS